MKEIIRNLFQWYFDICKLKLFSFHVFEEGLSRLHFCSQKVFFYLMIQRQNQKKICENRCQRRPTLSEREHFYSRRIAVQLYIHYSGYTVTKVYEIINKDYWWLWWLTYHVEIPDVQTIPKNDFQIMTFQNRLKYMICTSLVAQIVKSLQAKQGTWV